jgi:quinol-cytochrome oxidoreductase complex cytochrome b subunit
MRPSFFHHLHPPTIPAEQSRLRYTLGAGGMAVYLTFVVLLSGILEMFYYQPSPAEAALSIQELTYHVPFGGLVRNIHYWSAQLLLVVVILHLLRVIFTGSYTPPRRFNYLLGLALLVFTVFLDFTGYVLRWDQGVHWALVAGTNLLKSIPLLGGGLYHLAVGGEQPGPATLLRFYTWHIFGLVLIFIILGVWHLFRVRRDGGIAVPPPEQRTNPRRISRHELVRREGLAALLATSVLLLMAAFLPAPIAAPIGETGAVLQDTRAPWFFLWVQELLKLGSPFIWGVLAPTGVLIILVLFSYTFPAPAPSELGRWNPQSNRAARYTLAAISLAIIGLTIAQVWP